MTKLNTLSKLVLICGLATATLGAGVTFTFQTIGENAMFLWSGAAWVLVSLSGNVVVTNYTNLTTADVT